MHRHTHTVISPPGDHKHCAQEVDTSAHDQVRDVISVIILEPIKREQKQVTYGPFSLIGICVISKIRGTQHQSICCKPF